MTREGADRAMAQISGSAIGGRPVRCGWAHNRDALQSADSFTFDQVRVRTQRVEAAGGS